MLLESWGCRSKAPLGQLSCCSAAQSCPILCNPMDRSTPGSPDLTVSQSLLKFISIAVEMYYVSIMEAGGPRPRHRQVGVLLGPREHLGPRPSPSSSGICCPQCPWACRSITPRPASIFTWGLLGGHLSLCPDPLLVEDSPVGLGPTLMTSSELAHIGKDLICK